MERLVPWWVWRTLPESPLRQQSQIAAWLFMTKRIKNHQTIEQFTIHSIRRWINPPAITSALKAFLPKKHQNLYNENKNDLRGDLMPFKKIFYHIVWGTKNREPIITTEIEPYLFGLIIRKAVGLGGIVHAINGSTDHVHLIVTIPVTITIAKFIGQLKGVSSTKINKSGLGDGSFYWQSQYSVFTISEKELPFYKRYVKNQKLHHHDNIVHNNLDLQ